MNQCVRLLRTRTLLPAHWEVEPLLSRIHPLLHINPGPFVGSCNKENVPLGLTMYAMFPAFAEWKDTNPSTRVAISLKSECMRCHCAARGGEEQRWVLSFMFCGAFQPGRSHHCLFSVAGTIMDMVAALAMERRCACF